MVTIVLEESYTLKVKVIDSSEALVITYKTTHCIHNSTGMVFSLGHIDIRKVFFMLHHVGHLCIDVI
jgi:hypothetical protein